MTDDYLITVEDTAHEGQQLRMVACPLPGCEATQGEDYAKYARHLAAEHGPEDVGLSASSPRLATDGGQCAGVTERATVLSEEEAQEVASCLEGYFYDTEASAYDHTEYRAAYLAMQIRDRAGIEPNPSLLEDKPDAPDGFQRESDVECHINRPESAEDGGGRDV
jgi:hypothetical protein